MYVPHFNSMADEAQLRAFVAEVGAGQLITIGADGYPVSTLLPVIWAGDRVVAHLAKANPHWRDIASDTPAIFVCQGHQAYVSPSWYATKAEHGRVVPTWNYSAVELKGRVSTFDDVDLLREHVTELTDHHEHRRELAWSISDAPATFIDGKLRGIVGIEMRVQAAVGKAKLSQNRSREDSAGVIAGLRAEPHCEAHAVSDDMRRARQHRSA